MRPKWTRHRRRQAVFLGRAVVATAILAGLGLIAFQLPNGPWQKSTFGIMLNGRRRGSVTIRFPPEVLVVPTPTGFVTMPAEQYSPSSSSPKFSAAEHSAAMTARLWHNVDQTGVWAIATRRETLSLEFVKPDFSDISDIATASPSARQAALDWYAANGYATEATRLAGGNIDQSTPIWSGYALNAASLLLLVGSIITMPKRGWSVLVSPPPIGICNACGYDLTGLRTSTCPECGATVLASQTLID